MPPMRALTCGGHVHCVTTQGQQSRGQSHPGLTRHEIAVSLRNRKERMTEMANAFIASPGDIRTIEGRGPEVALAC